MTKDTPQRPWVDAGSLLTFLCGAFVLFLICLPVLQRNLSAPEVSGLYWNLVLRQRRAPIPLHHFLVNLRLT